MDGRSAGGVEVKSAKGLVPRDLMRLSESSLELSVIHSMRGDKVYKHTIH